MIPNLTVELDLNRKRLQYYVSLKEKSGAKKSKTIDKWIEIYEERVTTQERQLARQQAKAAAAAAAAANPAPAAPAGLRVKIDSPAASRAVSKRKSSGSSARA